MMNLKLPQIPGFCKNGCNKQSKYYCRLCGALTYVLVLVSATAMARRVGNGELFGGHVEGDLVCRENLNYHFFKTNAATTSSMKCCAGSIGVCCFSFCRTNLLVEGVRVCVATSDECKQGQFRHHRHAFEL